MTHPRIPNPADHVDWNAKIADKVAGVFGTMTMFWILVCWQVSWMTFATLGFWVFKFDPYPFTFCLFLSNLIQLWALPILGTATNRADQRREIKAESDHAALVHIADTLDALSRKVGGES